MGKKKRGKRTNTTTDSTVVYECARGGDDDRPTDDDNRNVASVAPTTMMGLYTKARIKRPAAAKKLAARTLLGTYSASPLELLSMLRDGQISDDDFNRLTPRRFNLTQDELDSINEEIPKTRTPVEAEPKDVSSPPPMTSLSIGDTIRINGLISAPEYNGTRGVIVSAVDNE